MKKSVLKTQCPFCYGPTSSANDPYGERVPTSGDYGLCQFCGELSVFMDKGQRLRKPTPKERATAANNPPAQALRKSWLQARHA
jgi:hypothetical protein